MLRYQLSIVIIVIILTVLTTFPSFVSSKCSNGNCDKFECISKTSEYRPLDTYYRTISTFHSPCSCSEDWNTVFCNSTLNAIDTEQPPPTVCVCRKFADQGSCTQFMTRCYAKKNNQCACCFNQPRKYCHHLKCKNGEPDFNGANTSCVCHHSPSNYPYDICKYTQPKLHSNYPININPFDMSRGEPRVQSDKEFVVLFGKSIATSTITYFIIGLLLIVSVLTLIMLLVGSRKLRLRRLQRERQTRQAREMLIMQRAEDDRYLPAA